MKYSQKYLLALAVILNFLVTCISLLHKQPFNVDGIIYLNTAQAYLDHGFKAAVAIYAWPFYSILIALTSHITHLPLLQAGVLLTAFLTSILVVTYVLLIKELGGTIIEQYLGLLIILIFPFLNHDRYNILRDFGYYAFFLLSLLYLIRYLRLLTWPNAFGFTISLIIAVLFRLEGTLVLAFAPLAVLFKPQLKFTTKFLATLKLYTPSIILGSFVVFIVIYKFYTLQINLNSVNILFTALQQGPSSIFNNFSAKELLIQQNILNVFGQNDARSFLVGGIIAIFINTFFSAMGMLFTILVLYALFSQRVIIEHNARLALYAYISICIITMLGFIVEELFLVERYILPLCLLLLLFIPFSLTALMEYYSQNKKKYWLLIIIGFAFIYTIIASFGQFGTSKTYILTAGDWLKKHTPANSHVYSNDPTLTYYSERAGVPYTGIVTDTDWLITLKKAQLNNFDYMALVIHNDELNKKQQVATWLNKQPIESWQNNFGDEAVIFELR
jgi:hypothetical protein